MLTFFWNGWQGKLFPESLKALAEGGADASASALERTMEPVAPSLMPSPKDVWGRAGASPEADAASAPPVGAAGV